MFTLYGTFRKQCIVHSSICTKVRKKNKTHPQNTNTSTPTITRVSWLCTVGLLPFVFVLFWSISEQVSNSITFCQNMPRLTSLMDVDVSLKGIHRVTVTGFVWPEMRLLLG